MALAQSGVQRVDLICPGFTSDCLETLEEISMEAREAFMHAGGQSFHYIPCLNDQTVWVKGLSEIALQHLSGWSTLATDTQARAPQWAQSRARAIELGAEK
jgi:ferrochelatase